MHPMRRSPSQIRYLAGLTVLLSFLSSGGPSSRARAEEASDEVTAIAIPALTRTEPVDFEKELLPIFRRSCLACHNETESKGDLVLETPATILAGGRKGPAAIPGKGSESKIVRLAAREEKPYMPPPANKSGAGPLRPEELALLRLWVDQGAKGMVSGARPKAAWHPLAPAVHPVYAASFSGDGRLLAVGRGEGILLYQGETGAILQGLVDPALAVASVPASPGGSGPGNAAVAIVPAGALAHRDGVQALAFGPTSRLLASGGYRTIKLWRRPAPRTLWEASFEGGSATAIALSPAGDRLAAGAESGALRLLDTATGGVVASLQGHGSAIVDLAFSPDGALLLSASSEGPLRWWRAADGAAAGSLAVSGSTRAARLIGDGSRVLTGSADGSLRLWATPGAEAAASAARTDARPAQEVAAAPASATEPKDGTARAGDGPAPTVPSAAGPASAPAPPLPIATLAESGSPITVIEAPPGANVWASGAEDGKAVLWSGADLKPTQTLELGAAVRSLALRKGGTSLFAAGASGVRLWSLPEGKLLWEEKGDPELLSAVELCTLEEGGASGNVNESKGQLEEASKKVAEAEGKVGKAKEALAAADKAVEEKAKAAQEAAAAAAAQGAPADAAKASEEAAKAEKEARAAREKAMAQASDEELTLRLARETEARRKATLAAAEKSLEAARASLEVAKKTVEASGAAVASVALSADGDTLLSAGESGRVRVYSLPPEAAGVPSLRASRSLRSVAISRLAVARDHRYAALQGSSLRWMEAPEDWALERTIGDIEDPTILIDRVLALGFSPDGELLASGGGEPSRGGELKLWSARDGSLTRAIPGAHSDAITCLEFSPDGSLVATGGADRFARITEVSTGRTVRQLEGHSHHVLGVSWRRNGRVLATAGGDGQVKVWDVESGEALRTIGGFAKAVTGLRFLGVSPTIATSSGDRSVRIHNVDNGQQVRVLGTGSDYLFSLAVTPDGRLVASGGYDGAVQVWEAASGKSLLALPAP